MLPGYKLPAAVGMTTGYGAAVSAAVLLRFFASQSNVLLALGLSIVSIPLIIWGCWRWAQGLGHHGSVGLFGLLFPLGTIILLVLPDLHPEKDSAVE